MSALSFIDRFRELHDKAKAGSLSPNLRSEYEQARRELGRLLLAAQQMSRPGETLRGALRIAQLIKAEVDLGGPAPEKTSTMDLASGGFAAVLQGAQPLGKNVTFTLQVPSFASGTQPLKGAAKVVSSVPQGAVHRVSFAFTQLAPADQEHLDMVIIDFVLRRFPPRA